MKVFKSTLFTGVMSNCMEYRDVDDFKSLPAISSVDVIDLYLKSIGMAFTKRKPTDIVNKMINELHNYCKYVNLAFSVVELENDELCITVDETCYIFDISYLRIITPIKYVTDYEIKEC